MSRFRRLPVFLLLFVTTLTMSAGCSTALRPEPGTVGGAIDALERAAEAHDRDAFTAYWDLEAVGTLYQQDSTEVADKMWMDEIEEHEATDAEIAERTYYPEDVAATRESIDAAVMSFVASGTPDPDRGILPLIRLENVAKARVHKDTAVVTFRDEGHVPEEVVLEFWRVEDNGEEKWIVSRIRNAKEIAKSRAAF